MWDTDGKHDPCPRDPQTDTDMVTQTDRTLNEASRRTDRMDIHAELHLPRLHIPRKKQHIDLRLTRKTQEPTYPQTQMHTSRNTHTQILRKLNS